MKYCVVELRSVTASFRNPEFQNFHKSLHLPPPTTMVGLAGAAMGLSPKAAQEWFEEGEWSIGVNGVSDGYVKDLWKYRTLDTNPEKASSIILREVFYENHFLLVFGSENGEKVEQLKESFLRPTYALTLGTSDALAKVVAVEIVSSVSSERELSNCLVSGNILAFIFDKPYDGEDFSLYTTSEPIAYDLPILFQYESDYGIRRVVKRKTLSFIGEPMELNFTVTGIRYGNKFIPVFPLHDDVS